MRDNTFWGFFLPWALFLLAVFHPTESRRPAGKHAVPLVWSPPAPEPVKVSLLGLRGAFDRFPGEDPDLPEIPAFRPRFVELAERFKADQWEATQRRERAVAAVAASLGCDYPYTYPGAPTAPAGTGVRA
ncbi:hypothetical protein ABT160_25070 [Streptomyces sp. NPDC001941]|uniref:hypothetical protein n=1 Tax=Streptomyces sp. NPDC001941 TaxID=3154659 RepID=UPI0033308595